MQTEVYVGQPLPLCLSLAGQDTRSHRNPSLVIGMTNNSTDAVPFCTSDAGVSSIAVTRNSGSSVKFARKLRLGWLARCMIQNDFRNAEDSEAVGLAHGDFGLVVQTLDDATGGLFPSTNIVED